MLKRVLLPIAHGTEELEAVAVIDILRRAGLQVSVGKVPTLIANQDPYYGQFLCQMSRGVLLQAEAQIDDF